MGGTHRADVAGPRPAARGGAVDPAGRSHDLRRALCRGSLALLACLAPVRTWSAANIDAAWRAQELRLYQGVFATPDTMLRQSLVAAGVAGAQEDSHRRLLAVRDAATAAQWLSREAQAGVRNALEAAVIDARSAGLPERSVLVDLLLCEAIDRTSLGRFDPAGRALDEAATTVRALGDPARLGAVENVRGLLAMAQGDGAEAIRHFDRALDSPPNDLWQAWVLAMAAMAARRISNPTLDMLGQARREADLAQGLADPTRYPVLAAFVAYTRINIENAIGQTANVIRWSDGFLQALNRLQHEQRFSFQETAAVRVCNQFHVADLALAESLQRRRLILTWALLAVFAVVGVSLTVLVMQVREKRRQGALSLELDRRNVDLQTRSQSRTRLLAAACHDLRQPAHSLGQLAELAELAWAVEGGTTKPELTQQHLQDIRRCSVTLADMLSELMDMSRLDGGQYQARLEPVSLQELLQDAALQFAEPARQKGLALTMPQTELFVSSDRQLLRRIVFNLVSNAVNYTPRGFVRVRLEPAGGQVQLHVDDSGTGIPPDRVKRIFEDYVRLGDNPGSDGLGIGLSIVQRAAELLGHAVHVHSVPGWGTTMSIGLGLARAPARDLPASESNPRLGEGRLVALLENDPESLAATTDILRRRGYRAIGAASGGALVRALEARVPHEVPFLIITDYHLDGPDGLTMVQTLRQRPGWQQVPALLITGDLDRAVTERARALGVRVTHKPVVARQLYAFLADDAPAVDDDRATPGGPSLAQRARADGPG